MVLFSSNNRLFPLLHLNHESEPGSGFGFTLCLFVRHRPSHSHVRKFFNFKNHKIQ